MSRTHQQTPLRGQLRLALRDGDEMQRSGTLMGGGGGEVWVQTKGNVSTTSAMKVVKNLKKKQKKSKIIIRILNKLNATFKLKLK